MRIHKTATILIFIGAVFALFGVMLAINVKNVLDDLKIVVSAKNELVAAVSSKNKNNIKAVTDSTRKALVKLENDLNNFSYFSIVPGANNELIVAKDIIFQVNYLLDSADLAIKISDAANIDFALNGISLTEAETLKNIDDAIMKSKEQIRILSARGDEIIKRKNKVSMFEQIRVQQVVISGYVKTAQQVERLVYETEDGVATLLGLRGEKKYLLMFENSDELRPGGGIISTYGLITMKDGQSSNLFVDHVHNLQIFYTIPTELNPDPIQQTMRHQKDLYIYDANWLGDPNDWLNKVFRSWNAQRSPVDGVIVMNTKMLEDVVKQYEPIKLLGLDKDFMADDIVASLDYYFEVQRANDYGRYNVLAPLVDELLKEIKSSQPEQLKILLANTKKRFQARDIYVYMPDQAVTTALRNNGIQNELGVAVGDEFYALQANLGSGKADGRMKRSLSMRVFAQEEMPVATATITQDYTSGVDDFRAGGYYGYVRFFFPEGTKLGTFDKFNLVQDENSLEAGRQVFGNYFSVATGTKKDVAISYALADSVAKQIKGGAYSLTLRKQGGVEMPFEIKINFPDAWKNPKISVADGAIELDKKQNQVTWKGTLTKDMQIEIRK